MKVHLMYPDRDFDPRAALPGHEPDLTADLELDTLLDAMAAGDAYLRDVARRGLHDMLMVPAEITYRQHVLADCAAHPDVIRGLYDLAIEAIAAERQVFGFMFRDSPEMILHRSRQVMALYVTYLRRLADLAARCAPDFRSEGLTTLCAMLKTELTAGYLAEMEDHLDGLEFRRGTLISARLGTGATGTGYTLRRHPPSRGWRDRLPAPSRAWQSFTIPERDEAGHRYVSELTGRGVNDTANALAQSVDHVKGFFQLLRAELGFYLGCLNLRGRLTGRGQPVCYPDPAPPGRDTLTARGLYDASLTLTAEGEITGNDLAADGKKLIMITGANQGGKSTFLRAVGQAQLMAQAGMFVPARECALSVCPDIFTHFKREEDATMEKGKLDEELHRMSAVADRLAPGSLLLCNESFASTNEREGSQIAREIIRALTEAGVRVVFVTHLHDLAESCHTGNAGEALFLRAERTPEGRRTFRLPEGEPLPTSYGEDLYRRIFAGQRQPAPT